MEQVRSSSREQPAVPAMSIFHGPASPPLSDLSLSAFLDQQCILHGDRELVVVPWTKTRWTYKDVQEQSYLVAGYLISQGIQSGDRVAILAGNIPEYISIFFGATRVGAVLVILNNTYTTNEAAHALRYTDSRILFATPRIGPLDNTGMLKTLSSPDCDLPALEHIVILRGAHGGLPTYSRVLEMGRQISSHRIAEVQGNISAFDVCNLQFTSGSTGNPKAAMLTHHGLLNNSRFIGDRMALTHKDILCCPPPLFHCFGLVLGMLACMTHGSKIVYPSDTFDPAAVLRAISDERCTALHGVPAMFDTIFSSPRPANFDCTHLRTGIIAGAPVPRHLMEMLVNELGMTEFTSSYGLTEASPTCFNAFTTDSIARRLTTVGTLLPHAHGKIIDREGNVVPVGTRGELCIAGYQLQRGYFRNAAKTAEVMVRDGDGVLWLHTGDEAVFDAQGYCSITGRFKEIIIRGGENIYPLEIEERLAQHPAIDRAFIIGIPHRRLGEVVGAFLQLSSSSGAQRPTDEDVRAWTRQTLGRHKAPAHVFWLGEGGVAADVPVTGSGKVKKFEMKKVALALVEAQPGPRL